MTGYLPKILITGSDGQIGMALQNNKELNQHFLLIARSHNKLDITQNDSIDENIREYQPQFIVNTAAFTAVDKAEHLKEICEQVNYHGAKKLAIYCQQYDIPLVHLSTDYVFDGDKMLPYLEEDKVNPINVYGYFKWLGEEAIRKYCKKHIIIRLSAVYSEYGNNFLKRIIQVANEKKELKVIADQWICPTYANDVASIIYHLCQANHRYGTYHYSSNVIYSWHDFALEIVKQSNIETKVVTAISGKDYPNVARRPTYSVLNCQKIKNDYNISQANELPNLSDIISKIEK